MTYNVSSGTLSLYTTTTVKYYLNWITVMKVITKKIKRVNLLFRHSVYTPNNKAVW